MSTPLEKGDLVVFLGSPESRGSPVVPIGTLGTVQAVLEGGLAANVQWKGKPGGVKLYTRVLGLLTKASQDGPTNRALRRKSVRDSRLACKLTEQNESSSRESVPAEDSSGTTSNGA